MKAQGQAEVVNELGLHLRAAGVFVREAEKYKSRIQVKVSGLEANAKSVLSVMSLAAGKGSILEISAEGPDAEAAVKALCATVAGKFGEAK
jgi:phosphocarrier protein